MSVESQRGFMYWVKKPVTDLNHPYLLKECRWAIITENFMTSWTPAVSYQNETSQTEQWPSFIYVWNTVSLPRKNKLTLIQKVKRLLSLLCNALDRN